MSAIGTKLRRIGSNPSYSGGLAHWCPACAEVHVFTIEGKNSSGAAWTWNGNIDKPTFTPSMLIRTGPRPTVPVGRPDAGRVDVCHYILTDGVINYCGDCTHGLAGQSVPLPDWPYKPGAYGGIEEP